jgi:hypothetical protein
MNNHARTQLDQLADMVSHNHDGLNTLASLLTCAADHPSQLPRPDELAHGVAGLISAIAWREQEAIELLSNLTRDMSKPAFEAAPVHVPTVAELLAEKNRYLGEVLESYGLTLGDLRDLKAGLVVLMAPPASGADTNSGRASA